MISLRTSLALSLLGALSCEARSQSRDRENPNIILIVADDLGYGDLGCYGQERIKTPNIDALAAAGRRYTQFYAGSTVCAPSRCSLMTGRHVGNCSIRGNGMQDLADEEVTLAEVLQSAGYATALVGKWGLGHEGSPGMPTRQGFDRFFGYLDQMHAHNYYPSFLIRDEARILLDNVVPNEGSRGQGVASERRQYSHDLLTEEALTVIRDYANRPFYLQLCWTIPHANNEAKAAGMEIPDFGAYADEDWPASAKGLAAMISRMDRDLGRILNLLEELDLERDTLVLFTSDNGPHNEGGNRASYFDSNGPLRGIKRSLTEGGIRVPLIARWPGRIPAGSQSDHIAAFWDLLPSFADLASAEIPDGIDGISFAADLQGKEQDSVHEFLYWIFYERGGGQACRMGKWKAIQQPIASPIRLYDLSLDPGEDQDLAAENQEVVRRAQERMASALSPSTRWRLPGKK